MIGMVIALFMAAQDPPADELATVDIIGERPVQEAWVRVSCEISAEGVPSRCQVLEESHPDAGFGEAALRAVAEARFSPRMEDGRPAAGRALMRIRFNRATTEEVASE